MTRSGFSFKSRVPIHTGDQMNYLTAKSGLWLPTLAVSRRELDGALRFVGEFPSSPHITDKENLARAALLGVRLHDKTGCWVADDSVDEDDHSQALWEIADYDMGGPPLNPMTAESKKHLRLCDDEGCLNARHYDFTHRRPYRDTIITPNESDYTVLSDGRILPVWEKRARFALPSLQSSKIALRALQRQCPPFVDVKAAPLSGNGISKITIDPLTGCWMVRMYYTRPQYREMPGFQYDGYGRLGKGHIIRKKGEKATPMLAHRVVWLATGNRLVKGKELNHKCGVRPCCNPNHIEQVSKSRNNQHAYEMAQARKR